MSDQKTNRAWSEHIGAHVLLVSDLLDKKCKKGTRYLGDFEDHPVSEILWQLMFFSGGEKTLYLLTYHFCNFGLQKIEVKFVVIKMPPTQNVTAGNIDATSFHLSPDFADYHQHPDK